MPERITVRLDDAVHGRLTDAARARGVDVSSVVRQAVMAYLEEVSGTASTLMLCTRQQ
jgi:predicted transcriptional regulator